jgi:hypothetical protein
MKMNDQLPMNASLIVVAKKPEPGFTKTRLCPPFTPEAAAEFYRCLMRDPWSWLPGYRELILPWHLHRCRRSNTFAIWHPMDFS